MRRATRVSHYIKNILNFHAPIRGAQSKLIFDTSSVSCWTPFEGNPGCQHHLWAAEGEGPCFCSKSVNLYFSSKIAIRVKVTLLGPGKSDGRNRIWLYRTKLPSLINPSRHWIECCSQQRIQERTKVWVNNSGSSLLSLFISTNLGGTLYSLMRHCHESDCKQDGNQSNGPATDQVTISRW